MKKILGLDLGTNSIGWAIIEEDGDKMKIAKAGCRIIPMDAATLSDFEKGNTISQTAERTTKRLTRRIRERFLLRRERLHRILKCLNFLPEHYQNSIGWDLKNDKKHFGKFLDGNEPKIAWVKNADTNQYEFLFKDSFYEMLDDFKRVHPEMFADDSSKLIPYDWTLYYLRKKALEKKISKEELAWIILNFNQKRGYHQLRDEVFDVKEDSKLELKKLKVSKVEKTNEVDKNGVKYLIYFENSDLVYIRSSRYDIDWVGKEKEIIVKTKIDENGNPKLKKDNSIDRSISMPSEDNWNLRKLKAEDDIKNSKSPTVGAYIYDAILYNPDIKIIGGLVRTIERTFYKEELKLILQKQAEFHPELLNPELYKKCISELYKNNVQHRNQIAQKDFRYLILDDAIFYQRPLKSKKSLIADCNFEVRKYYDKESKEIKTTPVKCIAKSNPYFQEFRIWQFISNLKIIKNSEVIDGKTYANYDVTNQFLKTSEDYQKLFDFLNEKSTIKQDALLKHFKITVAKAKKDEAETEKEYRWNYVEDKEYPCNKTRSSILSKLTKEEKEKITNEQIMAIWHLLYSVSSREEIDKALSKESGKSISEIISKLSDASIEKLKTIKFADEGYGSFSEKAIKKLLPLMRCGNYWKESEIDSNTKNRIENIINGEFDENINDELRERINDFFDYNGKEKLEINGFQALPVWLACYLVYGRHSEVKDITKWETPEDIDNYLKKFRLHSLNNPIVESVVCETLRVVKNIWKQYGKIDEIHVELARDMKKTKEERERISKIDEENENTNLRIKNLLAKFKSEYGHEIENIKPHSPYQAELFKIYEQSVIADTKMPEEEEKIFKKMNKDFSSVTNNEITKYKCWLEQKYCSPYTGQPISLSKLFTTEYEIEHIIPKSLFFDDSLSNKVICEAHVNKAKDNDLAYNFIKKNNGKNGLLTLAGYEDFVAKHYNSPRLRKKRENLLRTELPQDFSSRQLNDSRYISSLVKTLMSNIVREKGENGNFEAEATSKNVVVCNGTVTDTLKKDWGVNNVWNELIIPRFRVMNEMTGNTCFISQNTQGHDIPNMPTELSKGFNSKRIDHRHHAMDAIVIACTTRNHVNLLNNEYASSGKNNEKGKYAENKYQISNKLRNKKTVERNGKEIEVFDTFKMPWDSFPADVKNALDSIVISYKQNLRILKKATNYYECYIDGKKSTRKQAKGEHYAIRRSLHKDTVFGEVKLKREKGQVVATRKDLVALCVGCCNEKKPFETIEALNKMFQKITDEGIQKILFNYLKDTIFKVNDTLTSLVVNMKHPQLAALLPDIDSQGAEYRPLNENSGKLLVIKDNVKAVSSKIDCKIKYLDATVKNLDKKQDIDLIEMISNFKLDALNLVNENFSADGLEKMNASIRQYNNNKDHKPVSKVRIFEPMGTKFNVGQTGNNKAKFVEADSGTNLYFGIYVNEKNERSYETIPLTSVIDNLKKGKSPVPEFNEDNDKLLFYLQPNDLVYLPKQNENIDDVKNFDIKRIYRFVDSSKDVANFVPQSSAKVIFHIAKDDAKKYCLKKNGKGEIDIIQDEYGKGSPQSKNQKTQTGEMIKAICIPLAVDRLGNFEIKKFD